MNTKQNIASICVGAVGSIIIIASWFANIPPPLYSIGYYCLGANGGMWLYRKLAE